MTCPLCNEQALHKGILHAGVKLGCATCMCSSHVAFSSVAVTVCKQQLWRGAAVWYLAVLARAFGCWLGSLSSLSSHCCVSDGEGPGTCHTSPPPQAASESGAAPMSEALVRELIRQEVTSAVAAALSGPSTACTPRQVNRMSTSIGAPTYRTLGIRKTKPCQYNCPLYITNAATLTSGVTTNSQEIQARQVEADCGPFVLQWL